jgi:methylated-DNA-[protein]-cysteine S-methyltransferase
MENVFLYRLADLAGSKSLKNCTDDLGNTAVVIAEEGSKISKVFFADSLPPGSPVAETPLIKKAACQIGEYLAGERREFSLPLAMHGSGFQTAVWQALLAIPYGQTKTYGEIAAAVGNPKASRAVGMANNRNPVAIIVPCHRVIGSDGSLIGYAAGLKLKRWLLELEQAKSGQL